MKRYAWLAMGGLFSVMGVCAPAAAQMFRCGNTYQDRPCEAGQAGKVIGITTTTSSTAKSVSDSECAQRGAQAQKIMWARESGATAEKQLAESKRPDERKLILEVYQKRGSAPEVRAAIEADCVAEKERLAQAAALTAAAAKLSGQGAQPAATPIQQAPGESEIRAAEKQRRDEELLRDAQQKKSRCDTLESQLEDIRRRQRAGATSEGMEILNQRRRDVEKTKGNYGC